MTIVAMKMEHAIKAPKDGVIKSVLAVAGDVSTFLSLVTSLRGNVSLETISKKY